MNEYYISLINKILPSLCIDDLHEIYVQALMKSGTDEAGNSDTMRA